MSDVPNFGFTFVFKRSSRHLIHSRSVYTFLEFLGDVGGLNGALQSLVQPLLSLVVPSLLTRSLLNENFRYDAGDGENGENRDGKT